MKPTGCMDTGMIRKEYQEWTVDHDFLTLFYLAKELQLNDVRLARKETVVIDEKKGSNLRLTVTQGFD